MFQAISVTPATKKGSASNTRPSTRKKTAEKAAPSSTLKKAPSSTSKTAPPSTSKPPRMAALVEEEQPRPRTQRKAALKRL